MPASAPIEHLRAMNSEKTRGVPPAGRKVSGSAVQDISAAHITLIENLLIAYKRCAAQKQLQWPYILDM